MGVCLGRAPEFHVPADIVPTPAAQLAAVAGLADLEGHMVAWLERRDVGAHGGDYAGGFMAKCQGLLHQDVAIAEVAKVVQVRAAQAGGLDGYLDVVGAEGRQSPLFLEDERR